MFEQRITHQFDLDELCEEKKILASMRRDKKTIDTSKMSNTDSWMNTNPSGSVTIIPPSEKNGASSYLDKIIDEMSATSIRNILLDMYKD
jgi:hypothetical protein